jgi:hypothetical protein
MGVVFMFKRNHVSVLAMLASFLFFTACSDDAVSNPTPVATESSAAESSSSEVISNPVSSSEVASSSSEILSSASTFIRRVEDFSECRADNEGAVDSVLALYWTYYECKQGTWEKSRYQRALRVFPTCGSEREGAIDSMFVQLTDSAYYRDYYYFKCEQGTWIDLDHAAPLAAAVQAQCRENRNSVSLASYDDEQTDYWCGGLRLSAGGDPRFNRLKTANIAVFTYTDNGWIEEKCDAANEGKIAKYHYEPYHAYRDMYFKCSSGKWNNLGEQNPESIVSD